MWYRSNSSQYSATISTHNLALPYQNSNLYVFNVYTMLCSVYVVYIHCIYTSCIMFTLYIQGTYSVYIMYLQCIYTVYNLTWCYILEGIPALVKLLQSNRPDIQSVAASVLCNISEEGTSFLVTL